MLGCGSPCERPSPSEENTCTEPIRVLALHAHPDDVEFQCAGTLILLREAGCHVTIATMTPGDCGSAEHDAEAIAAIRREEARASAALIGADYLCLEFRDLAIFNDDESRRRVTEALRRIRPDDHPDGPTGRLHRRSRDDQPAGPRRLLRGVLPQLHHAAMGARAAAARRSRTSISSTRSRASTATGGRCRSISIVDVSRVFATKRAMLACHASQRNWLLRQHGIDEYLEMPGAMGSAAAGAEIGVAQAEAFRQYRGHPYPAGQPACSTTARAGVASGKPASDGQAG